MSFRDQVYRQALAIYGDPVEAEIAAAQAQLETGGRMGPGYNLFGIKGPGQSLMTTEVVDGQPVRMRDSFRAYSGPEQSIRDRLDFLRRNPRYAKAGYFDAQTAAEKAEALQRAGYATDPHYASKLKSLLSEQMQIIDASDFPQFSPAAMSRTLQPVSAGYPGMSSGMPAPTIPQMPQMPAPAANSLLTQLTVDPLFNIGMSLLQAGTSGEDLGSAVQSGMTGALRNQLLMDQMAQQRAGEQWQRQMQVAQMQQQQQQFAQQQAEFEFQQRKFSAPELREVNNRLYRIDPMTGASEQIAGPEISGQSPPEGGYRFDEDLSAEVAAGNIKPDEAMRMTEQRRRTEAQNLINLRKEFGGVNAKAALTLDSWNSARHFDPMNMNPAQDYKLVRLYAKSILPKEGVMSDDSDEIMNMNTNDIERIWSDMTQGRGYLGQQKRIWILHEMRKAATNAAETARANWTQFSKIGERMPGVGLENLSLAIGEEPTPFVPRETPLPALASPASRSIKDMPEPEQGANLPGGFTMGGAL